MGADSWQVHVQGLQLLKKSRDFDDKRRQGGEALRFEEPDPLILQLSW